MKPYHHDIKDVAPFKCHISCQKATFHRDFIPILRYFIIIFVKMEKTDLHRVYNIPIFASDKYHNITPPVCGIYCIQVVLPMG